MHRRQQDLRRDSRSAEAGASFEGRVQNPPMTPVADSCYHQGDRLPLGVHGCVESPYRSGSREPPRQSNSGAVSPERLAGCCSAVAAKELIIAAGSESKSFVRSYVSLHLRTD
jgi:hypothetical protein